MTTAFDLDAILAEADAIVATGPWPTPAPEIAGGPWPMPTPQIAGSPCPCADDCIDLIPRWDPDNGYPPISPYARATPLERARGLLRRLKGTHP